jgi:hypothetical protein
MQKHFCTLRAVDSRTVKSVEVWTFMSKCGKAIKNRQNHLRTLLHFDRRLAGMIMIMTIMMKVRRRDHSET